MLILVAFAVVVLALMAVAAYMQECMFTVALPIRAPRVDGDLPAFEPEEEQRVRVVAGGMVIDYANASILIPDKMISRISSALSQGEGSLNLTVRLPLRRLPEGAQFIATSFFFSR